MTGNRKMWLHLAAALLILATPPAMAGEFVHHVIVLIDRSGPMDATKEKRDAIRQLLTTHLEEVCFSEDVIVEGRALLDEGGGDYLSILSFGMEKDADLFDLIHTVKGANGEAYRYRQDFREGMFLGGELWNAITNKSNYTNFFNTNWSAVSLAMPMAIHHLRETDPDVKVHKTFVVFISREAYNAGADSILEFEMIKTLVKKDGFTLKHAEETKEIYKNVQTSLVWDRVPKDEPFIEVAPDQPPNIKMKVFEFIPIARVFSIESLIQYDVRKIDFDRVHGGFQSDFTITPINQDGEFIIEKMEVGLYDNSGQIVNKNEAMVTDLGRPATVAFDLNHNYFGRQNGLKLKMKFWVQWKSPVYGVHVLHPNGTVLQGSKGLNRKIAVAFEPPMKVWGAFSLSNAFFDFTTDLMPGSSQQEVMQLWEAISAGAVIFCIIVFIVWLLIRLFRGAVTRKVDQSKIKIS